MLSANGWGGFQRLGLAIALDFTHHVNKCPPMVPVAAQFFVTWTGLLDFHLNQDNIAPYFTDCWCKHVENMELNKG